MPLITFDENRERSEQDGSEWKFGAIETDLALVPVKDRMLYTPQGVLQYNNVMDTNGCASRAPLNILEAKLNWFYDNGMHPAIQTWMNEKGYRIDGKFVLCDAFIEILSGTTRSGNSLKAPVSALKSYGAIPAALIPLKDGMTWEQYMDRNRVTEEHLALGREFLARITLAYEQVSVSDFLNALEDDLLDVAGAAWPPPVNGVYPRNDGGFNHAFATVNPLIDALDNYQPFVKRLDPSYRFFDWGYQLSITAQNPYPEALATAYNAWKIFDLYGIVGSFADYWARFTQALKGIIWRS